MHLSGQNDEVRVARRPIMFNGLYCPHAHRCRTPFWGWKNAGQKGGPMTPQCTRYRHPSQQQEISHIGHGHTTASVSLPQTDATSRFLPLRATLKSNSRGHNNLNTTIMEKGAFFSSDLEFRITTVSVSLIFFYNDTIVCYGMKPKLKTFFVANVDLASCKETRRAGCWHWHRQSRSQSGCRTRLFL